MQVVSPTELQQQYSSGAIWRRINDDVWRDAANWRRCSPAVSNVCVNNGKQVDLYVTWQLAPVCCWCCLHVIVEMRRAA